MTKYHYRIPARAMDTIGRRLIRDIEIQYADMTPAQQQIADASQLDFAQIRWGFVSAWECSSGEACRVEQAVGERNGYFYHVRALA